MIIIVVQSGDSRQEHQKKEIHTMKKMINSAKKKQQPAVQYPEKYNFSVSNRQSSKIIPAYVLHAQEEINEKCESICCVNKQDNGAYHETKQYGLLCGENIHILGSRHTVNERSM